MKLVRVFKSVSPVRNLYRTIHTETRGIRRKLEDVAEDFNPVVGNWIKGANNVSDTVENFMEAVEGSVWRTFFAKEIKDLYLGDHLFVQRFGYTHHGVYVGNGQIIHYLRHAVQMDSLEVFAEGSKIQRMSEKQSPLKYGPIMVQKRALKRLGEKEYNLIIRNCEHFVRWCRNGSDNWV